VLYAGEEYSFCFNLGFRSIPQSVRISSRTDGGLFLKEIPLQRKTGQGSVSRRWARERIAFLETQCGSGSGPVSEAVETSIQYGVISKYTSYLAQISRKDKNTGRIHTVVVPSALPSLWEDENTGRMPPLMTAAFTTAAPMPMSVPMPMKASRLFGRSTGHANMYAFEEVTEVEDDLAAAVRNAAIRQKADGSLEGGADVVRNTSWFVIGMLLSGRWRPFKNQLKKAARYLLGYKAGKDGLWVAVALRLASEKGLADKRKCAEPLSRLEAGLNEKERGLYTEAGAERWENVFDFKVPGAANREKIAARLLALAVQ
jgi:hypothetical protein